MSSQLQEAQESALAYAVQEEKNWLKELEREQNLTVEIDTLSDTLGVREVLYIERQNTGFFFLLPHFDLFFPNRNIEVCFFAKCSVMSADFLHTSFINE